MTRLMLRFERRYLWVIWRVIMVSQDGTERVAHQGANLTHARAHEAGMIWVRVLQRSVDQR